MGRAQLMRTHLPIWARRGLPISRPNQKIFKKESMLKKFMKCMVSAALVGGLLLPAFLGHYALGYQVGLLILIAAAATVVIFQAVSLTEYSWVAAFCVVAWLFSPVVPLGFSTAPTLVVDTLALILFGPVPEAAENAATAFYRVYYGPHAG